MQRLQEATDEAGASDVVVTAQDREVSLAQSLLAELGTETRPLDSGGQEVQFGTGVTGFDWFRWLGSVADRVRRRDAHPLVRPPHPVADQLTGDLTVAMTADWATGLYGAPRIAETIRRMAADRPFDLLMHLGDVYYSGTPEEVEQRFLPLWPSAAGRLNRALNANHDMYSGGFGYFERILPKFKQDGSYFAVQNEHWLLVGLDTAYVDHDIDVEQVTWLDLIARAGRRSRVARSCCSPTSSRSRGSVRQGPKLQSAPAASAGPQGRHGVVLGPRAPVRDLRPAREVGPVRPLPRQRRRPGTPACGGQGCAGGRAPSRRRRSAPGDDSSRLRMRPGASCSTARTATWRSRSTRRRFGPARLHDAATHRSRARRAGVPVRRHRAAPQHDR